MGKNQLQKFLAMREDIRNKLYSKGIPTTIRRYPGYDTSWNLAATLFFVPGSRCLVVSKVGDFTLTNKDGVVRLRKRNRKIIGRKEIVKIIDDIRPIKSESRT